VAEGYLVAETVRMVKKQTIGLPAAMDENAMDKEDLNIIRNKEIKSVAKRGQKLRDSLKKGFATVYEQCSREVKEKLKIRELGGNTEHCSCTCNWRRTWSKSTGETSRACGTQ
jgi:hypothetical protein